MHVHRPMRVDATTEADVATLGLSHKCDSCGREFTKQRALRVHMARWCDRGRTQRSRRGTLTDKAALDRVYVGIEPSTTSYISSTLAASYRATGRMRRMSITAWTSRRRRSRRLRYLGHVLRLPAESIVRRSLLALVKGGTHYPEGRLFSDKVSSLT